MPKASGEYVSISLLFILVETWRETLLSCYGRKVKYCEFIVIKKYIVRTKVRKWRSQVYVNEINKNGY